MVWTSLPVPTKQIPNFPSTASWLLSCSTPSWILLRFSHSHTFKPHWVQQINSSCGYASSAQFSSAQLAERSNTSWNFPEVKASKVMYLEPSTTRLQMALKANKVTHVSKLHDRMDFSTKRTITPWIQLRHSSLRTTYDRHLGHFWFVCFTGSSQEEIYTRGWWWIRPVGLCHRRKT